MKRLFFLFCFGFILVTNSTLNSEVDESLADKITGTYEGIFMNLSSGFTSMTYSIVVTKIDDNTIQIAPLANSTASSTFEATLTEDNEIITLKSADDILVTNGTYSIELDRLSYVFHLGGDNDRNIEIFNGSK
jgi:hypothetical protein